MASENDFEPVHPGEVAVRFSAQGDYFQVQYGVLDASGTALDVRIGWDDTNRLRVTVLDSPSLPPTKEVQVPRLGVPPIA